MNKTIRKKVKKYSVLRTGIKRQGVQNISVSANN